MNYQWIGEVGRLMEDARGRIGGKDGVPELQADCVPTASAAGLCGGPDAIGKKFRLEVVVLAWLRLQWLCKRLASQNAETSTNAAEALGQFGDRRAVEPLIGALGKGAGSVRKAAAHSLGKLGDTRAVEPLIRSIGDGAESVRTAVIESLGMLRDARAVEPLISVLGAGEREARKVAAEALSSLGEPQWRALVLGDDHDFNRLALSTEPRAIPVLIEALRNWYFIQNGERIGPMSEQAMRNLVRVGSILPTDLVWSDSVSEWVPARRYFRFAERNNRFSSNWDDSTPNREGGGFLPTSATGNFCNG